MSPKPLSQTIELSDGREITIETGKLAKQAHGSVVIKMGNCCFFLLLFLIMELHP